MNSSFSPPPRRSGAFTLVELMVATVVLIIILLMLVTMVNQTATIWRTSSEKVEQFRAARNAFESITRNLSQATLNTYYDYQKDALSGKPQKYIRQSDLRFINGGCADLVPAPAGSSGTSQVIHPTHGIFFNAPLGFVSSDAVNMASSTQSANLPPANLYAGMESLLNTWGYFIEYNSDASYRPAFLNNSSGSYATPPLRYRYRLLEFMVPSDQIKIYNYTAVSSTQPYYGLQWFQDFLSLPLTSSGGGTGSGSSTAPPTRPAHVLAENVVALVIYPQLAAKDQAALANANPPVSPYIAPGYTYNTAPPQTSSGTTPTAVNPATDPLNQLPPVVQVTLVAIDEGSALRLAAQNSASPDTPPNAVTTALNGLFTTDPLNTPQGSTTVDKYYDNLATLQSALVSSRLTYRTFTSNVSLRAAKWSRD